MLHHCFLRGLHVPEDALLVRDRCEPSPTLPSPPSSAWRPAGTWPPWAPHGAPPTTQQRRRRRGTRVSGSHRTRPKPKGTSPTLASSTAQAEQPWRQTQAKRVGSGRWTLLDFEAKSCHANMEHRNAHCVWMSKSAPCDAPSTRRARELKRLISSSPFRKFLVNSLTCPICHMFAENRASLRCALRAMHPLQAERWSMQRGGNPLPP